MRYAVLLVLSAAALASCGESGASGDPASSGDKGREAQERAQLQLQRCLREQGIDLPDRPQAGESGGSGQRPTELDRNKLERAMNGPCKKYRDKAFGNVSEEDREEMRDQMVKFSSCMRKHGVDLPDPGSGERRSFSFSADDPKVRKATEACRDLMPRGRGGAGPVVIGPGPR